MVRELFTMARSKKACIIFFDEVDAIGGNRSSSEDAGSDNEVQRTMLQVGVGVVINLQFHFPFYLTTHTLFLPLSTDYD